MNRFKLIVPLLTWLFYSAPRISYSQDYTQTQNRIKAIYAYNFVKEIKQPEFKKDGEMILCLMVKNGFYDELEKRVGGKMFEARSLKVHLISNISECTNCDMIFIDEELENKKIIRDDDCKSFIVTIGFFEKALSNIALVYQEKKLQLGINMPLCDKMGYKIASELVNLSRQEIVNNK